MIKRIRPTRLNGYTYQMKSGCGPLYVTINEDESGLFEIFGTLGKAGGCAASQIEAIGRLVSLALRSGVEGKDIAKQLQGNSCYAAVNIGENRIMSCSDAIAQAIKLHLENKEKERMK